MKLDKVFMGSVLSLYDELISNGISMVYIGKFTQDTTTFFSGKFEDEMELNAEDKKTKKRVFHTLVEILQNMQRHSVELKDSIDFGSGLFMLGKKDTFYYIITSNRIESHAIPNLTRALETVNNSTIEELRTMYKKQLRDGKLSRKGGAGLGLIDIARKTGEKLEYLFLPIDRETQYFVLKSEIDTLKIKEEINKKRLKKQ